MNAKRLVLLRAALLAVAAVGLIYPPSASAIDAADVLEKMDSAERTSFIAGAVDMASHLYAVDGNRVKADCAVQWLFDDADSNRQIHTFFEEHRELDAVGLLSALIDRHCGK